MTTEAPQPTAAPAVADVTGARIGAAVIDIIIMAVVFVVLAMLFGDSTSESDGDGASFSLNLGTGGTIIYLIISLGYYIGMEALYGQTVGKKLMGLKVVTVDGTPYSWGKSAVRNILRIIDGLPVFYLLGFIVMLASKQKQRIGDMAAGTIIRRV